MLRKSVTLLCLIMAFMLTLSSANAAEPKAAADQASYKLDKKIKIGLSGEGFAAGQEIRILIMAAKDGAEYDIGYALDPEPVPDDAGKWATTWDAGRFVGKKLVKEGANQLQVTDADYNALAEFTVTFEK